MLHRRSGALLLGTSLPLLLLMGLSGAGVGQPPRPNAPPAAAAARHFDAKVAPLLARACRECHNASAKAGGLDLTSAASARRGGLSGAAIVPGKPDASLLWKRVAAGDMPPKGPLSAADKKLLRDWIASGAMWGAKPAAADSAIRKTPPPVPRRASAPSAHSALRRLTVHEYIETVRVAVGVDIAHDARRLLPPDIRADGFSNTAYNLRTDLSHVEAYARLARIIADRIEAAALAARYTSGKDLSDANMRRLVAGLGRWVLRGPLRERETAAYLRVSKAIAGDGGDFSEAVRGIVEAMLQSPRFLYRIETQSGNGKPRPVGGYELATRLSYILWGAPPDKELMRVADAGELADRSRVAAQVKRMLRDPRAIRQSSRFIHEWLDLDRLEHLRPAPDRFPSWDSRLASDMREETLAYFRHVAWERNRPLSELLNAPVTFATPRLALHYGLRPDFAPDRLRRTPALQALYTFEEGSGDTIRDTSGVGEPLNLKIADTAAVKWGKGQLAVNAPTLIAAAHPPGRLIAAVKQSKALTIEAWVTPGKANQSGPARIVTVSSGPSERNFTLGHDGERYDVRLRAGRTDANGLPSVSSAGGAARPRLTHLVYTRDAAGKARLYVDGEEQGAADVGGDLSSWSGDYRLALANETTRDRPWQGAYHLVALYSRALTPQEIRAHESAVSPYDLSSVPGRSGGLLTQGSVLTVGGDDASMVARGLFILHDLLYGRVGNPPPGTDTRPVPAKSGMSRRAVAETRLANPACGGCHLKFEPLAFGLEKFDGIGAFHATDEHGNRLREDGKILLPGQSKAIAYKSTAELMNLLAQSERVQRNITCKVTQFALGRPLTAADEPTLDKIYRTAQQGGGTYRSLMTAIVLSDLVQMAGTEKNG